MARILATTFTILLVVQTTGFSQRRSYDPYRILKSEHLQKDLKLTKEQIKRIQQLSLQYEGTRALNRPEIAREVGITESQKKKMKEIRDNYGKLRSEYYKLRRTDRTKARKKYEELTKEYRGLSKKIVDVLTSTQKRKYEKMKGKPFDRSKLYPRPKSKKKRPDV